MNEKKYLSDDGLSYFLSKLKATFGLKETIIASRSALDTYILNVNYDGLDNYTSSGKLGIGQLGIMILGKDS